MSRISSGLEARLEFWLRTIADNITSSGGAATVAAIESLEVQQDLTTDAVDLVTIAVAAVETEAALTTAAVDQLVSQSFGGAGFQVVGVTAYDVITVAGGSGTLGIDIDSGGGAVAYDEAFSSTIETTIDNWLVTNAALVLAAHNIVASKSAADAITLTGDSVAGLYTFTDGGATMTATSAGQVTAFPAVSGSFHCIEAIDTAIINFAGTTVLVGDKLPAYTSIAAGDTVYGPFTAVQVVSGKVLAYTT